MRSTSLSIFLTVTTFNFGRISPPPRSVCSAFSNKVRHHPIRFATTNHLHYPNKIVSSSRSIVTQMSSQATQDPSTAPPKPPSSSSLEEISKSYDELISKLRTVAELKRVQSVLSYDEMVFMPQNDKTSRDRGAQKSALAQLIHEKSTESIIGELIAKAESDLQTNRDDGVKIRFDEEARILELTKDSFEKNERVPKELAAKQASLSSSAYSAWVKARKENDFKSFEPVLRDCFDTAKEVADAKRGPKKDISLYTQMLDDFEMGMSGERIDAIFDEIQEALVPLIAKVLASSNAPSTKPLVGTFLIKQQEAICKQIVKQIGFDDEYGRIDVSVHPFTSAISPNDVRITSRFSDDEWYQGLAATIHEGGHAIYEQNRGTSNLIIDEYLSMGAHESQSLFWERHVGLSRPFWRWAGPILKEGFEDFGFGAEELYGAVNGVSRSLIRVEADELTYPLHVILRYRIEKDVIEGNLDVKDIPERWNSQMKELLDIEVPSDDKGCLQDVHWSALAIGYFPTYLIGAATAAQLAHFCRRDIPDMEEKIECGEFKEIKEWLTDKVHRHGRRHASLDDLLESQVGEKLDPKYLIEYLTDKYTDLYKC